MADDGDSDDDDGSRPARALSSYEERAAKTFGQRAREAASGSTSTKRQREEASRAESGEIIKGTPGGGMEMSFIPSVVSAKEEGEKKKEKAKAKAKSDKGQFGSGLEKRTAAMEEQDQVIEGEDGEGRKRMRKVARSASRNVTRQL